ncbi:unnamed protein product [Urochloa humidicola]
MMYFSTSTPPGSGPPASPPGPPGASAPLGSGPPAPGSVPPSSLPSSPQGSGPTAPAGPPVRQRSSNWRPDFHGPEVGHANIAKLVDGVTYNEDYRWADMYLMFEPIEYVKRNPMLEFCAVPSFSDWMRWIFTDFTKHLERSLILILVSYHKVGLCFVNLTIHDLYIYGDGTFRLRGIHSCREAHTRWCG